MPAVSSAQRPQMPIIEDNVQFFGQLQETLARLERSQQELIQRLSQLETLNQELLETNQALFVLTRRIEVVRQEAKEQIISQIKLLLFPFLERMRETQGEKSYEPQLRKLMQCIEHADTVPAASTSSIGTPTSLTSQELRIASMIRRGMTNDDIAKQLHVAPTTVKTHRRNIRKKLGITGAKNRLYAYFQTPETLHAESSPPRSSSLGQQGESHRSVVIPLYPDRPFSLSPKELHTLSQGDL